MSSSLLLQQCPACLVRLTWIVFVMGGRWTYSWCLRIIFRINGISFGRRNNIACSGPVNGTSEVKDRIL